MVTCVYTYIGYIYIYIYVSRYTYIYIAGTGPARGSAISGIQDGGPAHSSVWRPYKSSCQMASLDFQEPSALGDQITRRAKFVLRGRVGGGDPTCGKGAGRGWGSKMRGRVADVPDAPAAPDAPDEQDVRAPDAPDVPDARAPDAPYVPGAPDAPDAPDAPGVPHAPDTPTRPTPPHYGSLPPTRPLPGIMNLCPSPPHNRPPHPPDLLPVFWMAVFWMIHNLWEGSG